MRGNAGAMPLRAHNGATERMIGRGDRIRTCDLLVPNQALYQAKLHPDDRGEAYSRTARVNVALQRFRTERSHPTRAVDSPGYCTGPLPKSA